MNYDYYYNILPNGEKCRNNLIYTSLISKDKKTLVQWYYNDTEYHQGKNQLVDPDKMDEKWEREVKYLKIMHDNYPEYVPIILDIDINQRKIYLEIDGPDFWQKSDCSISNYNNTLSDWQTQMLNIVQVHKNLNLYKYSMHPSSYFVIDGKLKSINYFFTYHKDEPFFSINDVQSHISIERQENLKKYVNELNISWEVPLPFETTMNLCWSSFSSNYPDDFIKNAKLIYEQLQDEKSSE